MRLKEFEIKPYKDVLRGKFKDPIEIIEYLSSQGFEYYGSGSFSTVYGKKGSNIVVKVVHTPKEVCWLKFANYVKQNPNPFFPKIGRILVYKSKRKRDKYIITIIEKLKSSSGGLFKLKIFQNVQEIIDFCSYYSIHGHNVSSGQSSSPIDDLVEEFYYFVVKALIDHKIKNRNTMLYINRLVNLDEKLFQSKKVQSAAERFTKTDLFKALSGIDYLMKTGCVGDLAQRNIMVRPSTGQMIFIDPVYKDGA